MAPDSTITRVAVVGAGVIGRSWAAVFLRAGCKTVVYDVDSHQLDRAAEWLDGERHSHRGRLATTRSLDEALADAQYVQESGPERLELKQSIYAQLGRAAAKETILASSTSAFDMTEISRGTHHPERCIVAHPVNPPHTIPVVEVLGGAGTSPETVRATCEFLRHIGQVPVLLKKHIHGFVLNRLQFALVREAIHLLKAGVADVDGIDAVVREGLGLRWALLGPFAVADTNKDEGVRTYFGGYEEWITNLMNQLGPTPELDGETIEWIARELDRARGDVPRTTVRAWRDRMVLEIRRLKSEHPLFDVQEQRK